MRKIIVIFSAIVMMAIADQSYYSFTEQLRHKYKVDSELRPSDTLCYMIEIPSLCKSRTFNKLSIPKRRKSLFDLLAKSDLFLCYTDAIDTVRTTYYHNPNGNMDYWYNTKQVITMVPVDTNLCHPKFLKKMKVLADYIRKYKPELIFKIDKIDGIDYHVYWALKENRLVTLIYDQETTLLEEYDAEEFIKNAADYYFSSSLRLGIMLEADRAQ